MKNLNEAPIQFPESEGEEMHFFRHTKAIYRNNGGRLRSDSPEEPIDLKGQIIPDASPAGIELAQTEAEKFFSTMNPESEALFFASSNQARALETAKIYKDIAKAKGFSIISPEHHRNPLAEKMDDEEIRVLKALSLKTEEGQLWSAIYNPPANMPQINWEKISKETREKWEEARKVVLEDDKGNWGANYSHHSDLLKEKGFIPEDQSTAGELFKKQFPQLLRLARFGAKKAEGGFEGKKIKVLAFGHENYISKALEEYFGEEGINNCEALNIDVAPDESVTLTRRGEGKTIEKE